MLNHIAIGKAGFIFFVVTPNFQFQPSRQGIYYRNAHTVQTTGNFIGIVVKFTAGVQFCHDNFCGRNTFFFVRINRHTASIVANSCRTIRIKNNQSFITISGQRFINSVVQHFINHVVQTGTVIGIADIHSRTFAHSVQTAQNFDGVGVIFLFTFQVFFFC